jgi:hypothetical protein
MPLLDYKLPVLLGKLLGFRQFLDLQSLRFTQHNFVFDDEYGFAVAVPNMHVDRPTVVAVEEKPIAIFFKNRGHLVGRSYPRGVASGEQNRSRGSAFHRMEPRGRERHRRAPAKGELSGESESNATTIRFSLTSALGKS